MAGPARTITPLPRRNASIGPAKTLADLGGGNRINVERDAILSKVLDGKLNNTGTLTLATGGATTTDIDDPRIGQTTIAVLVGIDQNGSASLPTISQSVIQQGKIRLAHAASGLTRTIGYVLFGILALCALCGDAWAQSPSLVGIPQSTDPTCAAGEYYLAVLSTGSKWRKCENGTWSDIGATAGAGEANTASNLGGGLANFDSKSGVDLRFNSFNSAHFDLATNQISVDEPGLESLLDLADLNGLLPLAKFTDDASSGLCLVSGGGGGDPSWTTCPGGGGGAPTTADYLVGTANGSLTAEIVVGTSPGGELGGTWASPTIDSNVIEELNQSGSETDLRYDSTANGYYHDADGDSARDMVGERESASSSFNDDIWIDEFANGSSTFGLQEAITHACTSDVSNQGYGAIIRIRGGKYEFGTATVTIPANCHGLTIMGAGPDRVNEGISSGTLLYSDHSAGAGFSFITVAAPNYQVRISNIGISIVEPGSSTRAIDVQSNPGSSYYNGNIDIDRVNINAVNSSKSVKFDADGVALYLSDPVRGSIRNSMFDGHGIGIHHNGTANSGGTVYRDNRISSGSTTGIGIKFGNASGACSDATMFGNTIEGNKYGVVLDTTTVSGYSCQLYLASNHFENLQGGASTAEDIRATGSNMVVSSGDTFAGGAYTAFHRLTQTRTPANRSIATDFFHGPAIYSAIVMDAGACVVDGVADGISDGSAPDTDVSACTTIQHKGNISFEGDTNDAFETTIAVTDPTADRTMTIPNANSTAVQAQTCGGTDKVSAISASGVVTCSADTGGGGSLPVVDTTSIAEGSSDATKEVRFEVDGLTTGTVRVITMPDSNVDLGNMTDAQVSNTLTASNMVGTGSTSNAVDLATAEVNGLLGVSNGGTGAGSFTSNAVLLGSGTSPVAASVVTIVSGAMDGVTTADFDGAVTGPSFAADETASPLLTFDDSVATDTNPESRINGDAVSVNNGRVRIEVEENADGTYYSAVDAKSTAGAVTVELGGNGTANFIQIAEGGVLTGEGTATIEAAALTGTVPDASIAGGSEEDEIDLTDLRDSGANTCTGGQSVRRNAGDTAFECFTPSSGSANFVEKSIALSGGSGYFSATVTGATWVTASSVIQCGVLGTTADGLTPEAIAVSNLNLTISNRVAGTGFDVVVYSPHGLEGTIRAHCVGA